MDRKPLLIVAVTAAVLWLWMVGVGKFFPPVPIPPRSTNAVASATNAVASATNQIVSNTNAATPFVATPATTPTNAALAVAAANTPEETQTLETSEAIYTFTSHGGGLMIFKHKANTE